jgi:hypothetical protein
MPTDLAIRQAAGAACCCVVGTLLAAGVAVAAGEQTDPAAEGLTVVHPVMHQNHLRNPGMGLIYYGTPEDPPDWADVLYFHMAWYDVEKAPGEFNFNTPRFQQALRVAEKHDRKLAIRLVTSWQNYETPIPRYLLDRGVRLFPHGRKDSKGYVVAPGVYRRPQAVGKSLGSVHRRPPTRRLDRRALLRFLG